MTSSNIAANDPIQSRRRFCVAAGAALAAPWILTSRRAFASATPRVLAFDHTHTGERLSIEYAIGDVYVPQALKALDFLLRDFRTNESRPIDPKLFDQLHRLAQVTGSRAPYQIISGYRSPATNDQLRKQSRGVASHSLHLDGCAIDVRQGDVKLADLRDAALSLKAGGVGYYPGSNFVHLDTGGVRRW
jgi:uncharacterized protein YcbK (DUF882 family)